VNEIARMRDEGTCIPDSQMLNIRGVSWWV
jgi:hypothetical protein